MPTTSNFTSVKAPKIAKRSSTSFAESVSITTEVFWANKIWVIRIKKFILNLEN